MIKEMPKWNELFTEALMYYADGVPHNNRQAKIKIADQLNLTEELRMEKTEKHGENKIEGRVGFALSALKISGLLDQYQRGQFVLTEEGRKLLDNLPEVLDQKYLINNYESYRKRREKNALRAKEKNISQKNNQIDLIEDLTPEELIARAMSDIKINLSNELLENLYVIDPFKFEYIIADLLEKMGYGDLEVTQKTNDGGIDATVNEDKLGLDKILVQTKRYAENNIIREKQIRDFLGALSAEKVQKGIFVTTSSFDQKALKLARDAEKKLVLIDGQQLTELMIDYQVGTSTQKTYTIKAIDTDYFDN